MKNQREIRLKCKSLRNEKVWSPKSEEKRDARLQNVRADLLQHVK